MSLLHIGDHTNLHLSEIGTHLIEPEHLIFAVLIVIAGVASYKHRQRAKARVRGQRRDGKI